MRPVQEGNTWVHMQNCHCRDNGYCSSCAIDGCGHVARKALEELAKQAQDLNLGY